MAVSALREGMTRVRFPASRQINKLIKGKNYTPLEISFQEFLTGSNDF